MADISEKSTSSSAHWEHFQHGADIGVRGYGPSLASAFEQAALALSAVLVDLDSVKRNETVEIELEAPNSDLLLYDWLNAIIFEMGTRDMIFGAYDVSISGNKLIGRAHGEAVDRERHQPAVEIKGATMTELATGEIRPGEWRAQCVVDV
jgi:tRNA nucleotidyltransferase (CCA-adding enzyme)